MPELDLARLASYSDDAWLKPGEVAALFGVNPKTVTRWATEGLLAFYPTLGGHRRYKAGDLPAAWQLIQARQQQAHRGR